MYRVADINDARNVAGGGINIAQRVMDCGDGGHILISKVVADVLDQVSTWKPALHDLGEAEVKHGVRVHIYNLFTPEAGNPELPQKLRTAQTAAATVRTHAKRKKLSLAAVATGVMAALLAGGFMYYRHSSGQASKLTDKDSIVLADFQNKTGDPIFDDTLKQALSVALNQSSFLNVLSDNKVAATLKMMSRPAGTKLTPEVTRELCERAGGKAYLAGSIASLGSQYVLGLQAVNCHSGDPLAEEQATAAAKEKVLDALGKEASKLRAELGESLASVQKLDIPLQEATTSSLEALKAYSLGSLTGAPGAAALPYYQRTIELDPNFAMAYETVGIAYENLGQQERANEYHTKAFQLREHASARERMEITTDYYETVTGELDKAVRAYQELIATYPQRTENWRNNLALVYGKQGQYEKEAEIFRQLVRDAPKASAFWGNLAQCTLQMQRLDETRQIIREMQARKMYTADFRYTLYALAFIGADSTAMSEQLQVLTGQPEYASNGLALASATEAYGGRVGKARELTKRAVDTAIRADSKETGAIWQADAALEQGAYGSATEARQSAAEALKLAPTSQGVVVEDALAFAMAGDTARADSLAQALGKRFPLDTQVQSLWLPAIQAQLALDKKNPASALTTLQADSSIELAQTDFGETCLYPVYVRGEAYLAAGQGAPAAAEFQKILDHSGIVRNCWTEALAHLGVARANALQARTSHGADADLARTRALTAYKNFLTLWKDADPDILIYRQAIAEYAKLQ